MPDYKTLPLDWQQELENAAGQQYYLDLLVDPEERGIVIDGQNSIVHISPLDNSRDMDPQWGGRSVLRDVEIEIADPDGSLSPINPASPFHHAKSIVAEAAEFGSSELLIQHQEGVTYASGERIVLYGEDYFYGSVQQQIVEILSYTADNHTDRITLAEPLAFYMPRGGYLFSQMPENTEVQVRLHLAGAAQPMVLFRGRILKVPEVLAGAIRMVLVDSRKSKLDRALVGVDSDETSRLLCVSGEHSGASSIRWNDDASCDLERESIFPQAGCRPGKWQLDFITNTKYTLSGPGMDGRVYDRYYGMTGRYNGPDNDMGFAWDLVKDLDWVFTPVVETGKLVILDVSDPASPVQCSSISFADSCIYAAVEKISNNVYVAYVDINSGSFIGKLKCFYVSDPYNPVLIDTKTAGTEGVPEDFFAVKCKLNGHFLYVQGQDTVCVFDVDDPFNIQYLSRFGGMGSPNYMQGLWDFDITDHYLLTVSSHDNRLVIIDIDAPGNPVLVTTLAIDEGGYSVRISGNYAFVKGRYGRILVIDISDIENPFTATEFGSAGSPWYSSGMAFTIEGDRLFSVSSINHALSVIDISDPFNARLIETIRGADGPFYLRNANAIAMDGEYAYIMERDGLTIYRLGFSFDTVQGGDQLVILASAWNGTTRSGNKVSFKTGRIWVDVNPVSVIYQLLREHAETPQHLIAASSFFEQKRIGVLAEDVDAGNTEINVAVTAPVKIQTGEILIIGGLEFVIASGNDVQASYPPCIRVSVNNPFGEDLTCGSDVYIKKRDLPDPNYNFDREYLWCEDNGLHISLSLERDMSVLQALECVAQHLNGFLYNDNWGVERLFVHRRCEAPVVDTSGDTNLLPGTEMGSRERVNSWQLRYGYDYDNNTYFFRSIYTGPTDIPFSQLQSGLLQSAQLDLPGYFASESVALLVSELYEMWAFGVLVIQCRLNLQGIPIEIGDVLHVQSEKPELDRYIRVTGKQISFTDGIEVLLKGYDITHEQEISI